jgi:hypothetical protein
MSGAPYAAVALPNAIASVTEITVRPHYQQLQKQLQELCVISNIFLNSSNGSASSTTASTTAAEALHYRQHLKNKQLLSLSRHDNIKKILLTDD